MKTYNPEILLLNPPFGAISKPYISIPVLAAYLRQRHVSVAAYDLDQAFYVRLLTTSHILSGLNFARERFLELNQKPVLEFAEAFEYFLLVKMLTESAHFKSEFEKLYYPFTDFSDIQQSRGAYFFIQMASLPYFPKFVHINPFFLGSEYDSFSSADLLKASDEDDFYTRLYHQVITEELLPRYNPRIIGFSVVFMNQIIPAFQCARIIKQHWPDVHITMGGPCISMHFREIQEKKLFQIVDSLVMDEGEIPLETLSAVLSAPQPDLTTVPGLAYLADDQIQFNPPAPSLNLEECPPPDFSVFELGRYLSPITDLLVPFRLSKGCPWQKCTFCRTNLPMCKYYQQPPVELMYQQLIHTIKTYDLSLIMFSDESADPLVLEYISQRLIEDKIPLKWMAHTRVANELTKQRCELYRQAGCFSLSIGIESFSDRILKLMRKGTSAKLIDQVLTEIDGIFSIKAYMIVGFPTETEEEVFSGFNKLQALCAKGLLKNYFYSTFLIIYGSDIWNNPTKYGISEMVIPEGSDLLPDIVFFTSSGMPREQAVRCGIEFNQLFGISKYLKKELSVNNQSVPIRYDLSQIRDTFFKLSFPYISFVQWLHHIDARVYPGGTR
jgi:anaerobic magnesium-protoporphyrin IX monomethyl ester cyclase